MMNPSITYAVPGTYCATLTVTNAFGTDTYAKLINVDSCDTAGACFPPPGMNDEAAMQPDITIYPNPSTGVFRIQGSGVGSENVEVYDLFGRKVYLSVFRAEIDLSAYAKGVYLLRVGEKKQKLVLR